MNDSEKLSDSDIQDLYERNRDLRNARINLAIGVITIFLALWAIILAFVSQIVQPESTVEICLDLYYNGSCNCSQPVHNVTQSYLNYFSLLQFLINNNVFNVLIFFGILSTIVLFLLWRLFARHLCIKQIKNYKKIKPKSMKSEHDAISEIVKNWDIYTFFIVEFFWVLATFELTKIWPIGSPISTFEELFRDFIKNSPKLMYLTCKFHLNLIFISVSIIIGWFILWVIWKYFTQIKVINYLIKIITKIWNWFKKGLVKIWRRLSDC
jgi:hypothetical protein